MFTNDFDLRRHHGFRNPPVVPPVPFPGAWAEPRAPQPRYFTARGRFNFRRPPGHWRSGPPLEFPLDHVSQRGCHDEEDYTDGASRAPNASTPRGYEGRNKHEYDRRHAALGQEQEPDPGGAHARPSPTHSPDETKDAPTEGYRQGPCPTPDAVVDDVWSNMNSNATTYRAYDDLDKYHFDSQGAASSRFASGARDSHDLDPVGVSTAHALDGVAAGSANPGNGDYQGGDAHEEMTKIDIWPGVKDQGPENGFDGVEPGAAGEEEEVELVMSPEWAEYFRSSSSVQRYLQRVAAKKGMHGSDKDARGGKGGKGRGNAANRWGKQQSGPSSSGKKGGKKKKNKKNKDDSAKHSTEDEVTVAQREMELQLAKIKAQALLYAHQAEHPSLEDIIEES